MVNAEQLKKLHIGAEWVDALNETFNTFSINTHRQQAAFIGQCGHECGNLGSWKRTLTTGLKP